MENAAKALMIAGGVLLAILTLSLVVYMMNAVNSVADAQDAKTLSEQIAAFNREYESYNKKIMYGTDVITVVKKAIDFNGGLDASESDLFVNIEIILTSDFTTTKTTIETYSNGDEQESTETIGIASVESGNHQLKEEEGSVKIDQNMIDFFSGDPNDDYDKQVEDTKITETYTYSALTNFKRTIFSCSEVHYNEENGRIDKMIFVQN